MSKILICDDHIAFRKGLNMMLQELPEVNEICEVSDGAQFLNTLIHFLPDLIFLDIRMPVISGIEATIYALKKNPELKIIILTMFGEEKYLKGAIDAGAKGFILKPPTLLQLKEAYQAIMKGGCYFSHELGFIK